MAVAAQVGKAPSAHDNRVVSTLLFHISRELRTALDRRFTKHGLTTQQAALLLMSRLDKDASPNKMADRLGTDGAGMTRLVDRLEAKGLVIRRAGNDRRSLVIVHEARGKALLPRLVPEFRRVDAGLLEGFSDKEVEQLRHMLIRLLKNAKELESDG
jgi:DNA-binding MarR family transcriptional regulator